MSVGFTCGIHGWMANGVPCPTCERQRWGYQSPLPQRTMLLDQAVEIRLSVLEAKVAKLERAAQAGEAGTAATPKSDAVEDEHAVAESDAPNPSLSSSPRENYDE